MVGKRFTQAIKKCIFDYNGKIEKSQTIQFVLSAFSNLQFPFLLAIKCSFLDRSSFIVCTVIAFELNGVYVIKSVLFLC